MDIDLTEAWSLLDIAKAAELSAQNEHHLPTDAEIVAGVSAEWYLIQTFAGDDVRAMRWLARRRFGVFRPMQQRVDRESGRRLQGFEPVFPGWLFVFCWMDIETFGRLVSVPGVHGLLCYPNTLRPVVVGDDFVQRIRKEAWVYDETAPAVRGHVSVSAGRQVKRTTLKRSQRQKLKRLTALARRNEIWDAAAWSCANRLDPGERIRLLSRALAGPVDVFPDMCLER
jgi:transcription antitermination factor NusG